MKLILTLSLLVWTALSQARYIDTIVIHTTDVNWTVKQIDDYHKSLGWDGCGYHFVIEKSGKVIQCRDMDTVGAHVLDHNESSVGIAWIGKGSPTEEQMDSMALLTAGLVIELDLNMETVKGHRDFDTAQAQGKTCPNIDMIDFKEKVVDYLLKGA